MSLSCAIPWAERPRTGWRRWNSTPTRSRSIPTCNGQFTRQSLPTPGIFPTRIASADLNGDGIGDLAVVNSGSHSVSVFLGTSAGGFVVDGPPLTAGNDPFDVTLADVNGDGRPDIVVTNAASGDVSVFPNLGNGNFGAPQLIRAGSGPFDITADGGVQSLDQTTAVAVGVFDKSTGPGVLAVNTGANTFSLLPGLGDGGLSNPQVFQAGSHPTQVVLGDFNKDGNLDAAILNTGDDTISIYLGDGKGDFYLKSVVSAGEDPTGFAAADLTGNGILDLVVGNEFGDVLVLPGNGDGTFRSFVRADQAVPFVTTDANGDVILANQSIDTVMSQNRQPGTTNFSTGSLNQQGQGLIAPARSPWPTFATTASTT